MLTLILIIIFAPILLNLALIALGAICMALVSIVHALKAKTRFERIVVKASIILTIMIILLGTIS